MTYSEPDDGGDYMQPEEGPPSSRSFRSRRSSAISFAIRRSPSTIAYASGERALPDAQCARCGSSVGVLDIHDYESVELFCMSRPEWCAQNPIKGRAHVRGAHFPIDTDEAAP